MILFFRLTNVNRFTRNSPVCFGDFYFETLVNLCIQFTLLSGKKNEESLCIVIRFLTSVLLYELCENFSHKFLI